MKAGSRQGYGPTGPPAQIRSGAANVYGCHLGGGIMPTNLMKTESNPGDSGLRSRLRTALGVRAPLPDDKPLRTGIRTSLFLAGGAMPLLARILADFPDTVEHIYSERIGLLTSRSLTLLSNLLPFSVAEMAAVGLALWVLFMAARGAIQTARKRRHLLNAAACGVLWLAAAAGILLFTAYLSWGFNFARADIITRQHWSGFETQTGADSSRDELTLYCSRLVELANREFENAVGSRDPGKPSAPSNPVAIMDAAIEEAYARVTANLKLHPSVGANRGRAKAVLASFAMSSLLIGGVYSPWTGEANFNRDLPAHTLPQAIAHEKAHQRGITNEDEANFFGFLACIHARDPYVRYSGYLFAQQQILGELRRIAPDRVVELTSRRDGGIQRDIAYNRTYVDRHRGLFSNANAVVIDAYLKANRAPAGIRSYSLSARLIIIYARAAGKSAWL
jgi:hypothetical protein